MLGGGTLITKTEGAMFLKTKADFLKFLGLKVDVDLGGKQFLKALVSRMPVARDEFRGFRLPSDGPICDLSEDELLAEYEDTVGAVTKAFEQAMQTRSDPKGIVQKLSLLGGEEDLSLDELESVEYDGEEEVPASEPVVNCFRLTQEEEQAFEQSRHDRMSKLVNEKISELCRDENIINYHVFALALYELMQAEEYLDLRLLRFYNWLGLPAYKPVPFKDFYTAVQSKFKKSFQNSEMLKALYQDMYYHFCWRLIKPELQLENLKDQLGQPNDKIWQEQLQDYLYQLFRQCSFFCDDKTSFLLVVRFIYPELEKLWEGAE